MRMDVDAKQYVVSITVNRSTNCIHTMILCPEPILQTAPYPVADIAGASWRRLGYHTVIDEFLTPLTVRLVNFKVYVPYSQSCLLAIYEPSRAMYRALLIQDRKKCCIEKCLSAD